jgi:hypothetical protein
MSGSSSGDGYFARGAKQAFAKVTNDIKTAAAQNEFLDDTNVDQGRIHNAASNVMDGVNIVGATANGVVSGTVTLATGGLVKPSIPTPRTLRDAFHKKANRVFDPKAVKECNQDAFDGETVTVDDRKTAYGQSDRGQKQVEAAKDKLDELYGVSDATPDVPDVPDDDDDDFEL